MAITELPARSFKAYAVVEALRNGSADIKSAIVPFFHPCMAFSNGKIFDAEAIAGFVNESYSWSVTADIVESLIPAFVECGWLTVIEANEQSSGYRINCYLPDGTFFSSLPDQLKELGSAFEVFIHDISPLSSANRTPEGLLDILLRWIVSLEAYSDAELREEIVRTSREGQRVTYDVVKMETAFHKTINFCAPGSPNI